MTAHHAIDFNLFSSTSINRRHNTPFGVDSLSIGTILPPLHNSLLILPAHTLSAPRAFAMSSRTHEYSLYLNICNRMKCWILE